MSKKLFDFLSSFGMMLLGVGLLFVSSVTAASPRVQSFVAKFPVAKVQTAPIGGDVALPPPAPPKPTVPLAANTSTFKEALSAVAAVVVDDQSDTILFSKNPEALRPLASITKLMSALVLSDLPMDWTTTTVISVADAVGASDHHVSAGERFTLEDLWHVALVGSSNIAIRSLARASGLPGEAFVYRMNKKTGALNLRSMKFVEPTGLDDGNVGNALDVARLLKFTIKTEKIADTLSVGEYYAQPLGAAKPRRIWSTDWLLNNWISSDFNKDGIVGKTGFIENSGYNFVVRLKDKDGHGVRVVVLGANSNEQRFSEARDLAVWAFSHYRWPDQAGYDKLSE